jgi:hypothetical protein
MPSAESGLGKGRVEWKKVRIVLTSYYFTVFSKNIVAHGHVEYVGKE